MADRKPALTTSGLRSVWGPPCAASRGVKFTFWNGQATITIDARILPAVRALDAILKKYGYAVHRDDTGAFVCRKITGGSGFSLHAYLIAIDINWQSNPYSAANRLVTDMPRPMVNEIVALTTNSNAPVWGWGGFYRSIKDTMHYEIVCTPGDLATGIRNVAAPLTDAQKLYIWIKSQALAAKEPFLKHGDTGPAVKRLQDLLGIQQTGFYGPGTVAAVKAFQALMGIDPRGKYGRANKRTWARLIYVNFLKNR